MAYRIGAIRMALSIHQGQILISSLSKWDFSYVCAAVDKISIVLMASFQLGVRCLVGYHRVIFWVCCYFSRAYAKVNGKGQISHPTLP